MRAILSMACTLGLIVQAASAALAGYQESWDTSPPGNNNWFYFVEGQPDNGNVPMVWQASGGQDRGYVRCPLGSLTQWSELPSSFSNYWPAYTLRNYHAINLNTDPVVTVYLKDVSLTGPPSSLGGGGIYFWIGDWFDPDGDGPQEPQRSFFYLDDPLSFGPSWTSNTVSAASGTWVTIVNDQGLEPADLFADPQQWGFGIFNGDSAPSGALGFDTLAVVPEPTALALFAAAALGLLGCAWWRRRR